MKHRMFARIIAVICLLALCLTACAKPEAPAKQEEPAETPEKTEEAPAETAEEPKEGAKEKPEEEPEAPEEPVIEDEPGELPKIKDEELLKKLQEQCDFYFQVKELKSMTVAVLYKGEIAYFNFGEKNDAGDPVDENTIYEIASVTKTFTGTLFSYNVDNGTLELEAPVADFFDHKVPDYRGAPMTLLQLATHTSGLPRVPTNFTDTMNPYWDYTEEMMIDYLQKGLLRHEPGASYEYSNLGVGLLGYIIGKVNDRPYDELLKETVLDPIGMDSTAIYLNEEQQARKASPYLESGAPAREWDFAVLQACGGLKSSTRDLIRYLAANLGDLETNPELAEAMANAHKLYYGGTDANVGLCWHRGNYNGTSVWAHDGLVGGYCSFVSFAPQDDLAVAILCNNNSSVTTLGVDLITTMARNG